MEPANVYVYLCPLCGFESQAFEHIKFCLVCKATVDNHTLSEASGVKEQINLEKD